MKQCLKKDSSEFRIAEEIKANIKKGQLIPGDRLLSEKELAHVYDTNLYNARKALRILKSEGVIDSRPKSGFFVKNSNMRESDMEIDSHLSMPPLIKNIDFSTISNLPLHKNMWSKINSGFRSINPYIEVVPRYDNPGSVVQDIVECGDPVRSYQIKGIPLLDIKQFIIGSGGNIVINDCFMPLYFHTHCLFYNASLLKKSGLPLPEYVDFAGQSEYHKLIGKAEKTGGNCLQLTNIQPMIFLGSHLLRFQEQIRAKDLCEENLELEDCIGKLIVSEEGLYVNLYGNTSLSNSLKDAFVSGKLAVFQQDTSILGNPEFTDLPFEWGIYPVYAIDDCAIKIPLNGVISQNTHDPVGCVRFLQFLQSAEAQKILVDAGCVPLRSEFLKNSMVLKRAGRASGIFESAMNKATVFQYDSYSDFYISYRIVNAVLFDCILKGKDKKDAVSEIIRLGKIYLNIKENSVA